MARVRQARRCRARSSRTGLPCRQYAVIGGFVCRTHGGAIGRVRVAAAQRQEREWLERAMIAAERRHAAEVEAWLIARLEEAAELLGQPVEETTFDDVRRCGELYGRPDPHDEPPRRRLDLRFGPRRPVVIRRR